MIRDLARGHIINGEGSGNITTNLSEAEALSMMEDDIKKLVKGVKNPKGHYEEFSLIVHRNECDGKLAT